MGAAREKGQADFDLERFIDMFDEALTSDDERVVNALRSLMMMVILTKSEVDVKHDRNRGPLRQLFDDMNHMNRRMHQMEEAMREIQHNQYKQEAYKWDDFKKYNMQDVKYTASSFDEHLAMAQISQQIAKKINGGKI